MQEKEQLLGIKRNILDSLTPLVIDGGGDSVERASTALSIIEFGGASVELFEKALTVINTVENGEQKTDLLMRLLANVQLALSESDTEETVRLPETDNSASTA